MSEPTSHLWRVSAKYLRSITVLRGIPMLLLLILTGCASSPGGLVGEKYVGKRSLAAANSKKCMDNVKSNNLVYERLSNVFIYDANDNQQFSKIINNRQVTNQNIDDLIKFREMIQPCYDQALLEYGKADDRYANYMFVIRMQSDQNLLDLLNKQITIGDRNVYLLETLIANRRKFAEIDRDVMYDINNRQYSEISSIDVTNEISGQSYDDPKTETLQQQLRSLSQMNNRQPSDSTGAQGPVPNCQFVGNTIQCGQRP